jgi:hypothetical protein
MLSTPPYLEKLEQQVLLRVRAVEVRQGLLPRGPSEGRGACHVGGCHQDARVWNVVHDGERYERCVRKAM